MDQSLLDAMEANESMFVQTANSFAAADGRLSLGGVAPATLYFSDRPKRAVGHVSNADFVGLWGEGENSFQEDPPNAVLAFLEPSDQVPEDVVVVIRDPRLEDGSISYAFDALEGAVPSTAGPCTLFIDPLGRPLSPMSIAGVRRRQMRRGR